MKKLSKKSLSLAAETIRVLDTVELGTIAAGAIVVSLQKETAFPYTCRNAATGCNQLKLPL